MNVLKHKAWWKNFFVLLLILALFWSPFIFVFLSLEGKSYLLFYCQRALFKDTQLNYWPEKFHDLLAILQCFLMLFHCFSHRSFKRWCPPDSRSVDCVPRSFVLWGFDVFFNQFWSDTNHMLAFPILDQIEGLKGWNDVRLSYRSHGAQIFDAQSSPKIA